MFFRKKKSNIELKIKIKLTKEAGNITSTAEIENKLIEALDYSIDEFGAYLNTDKNLLMLRTDKVGNDITKQEIVLDIEKDR